LPEPTLLALSAEIFHLNLNRVSNKQSSLFYRSISEEERENFSWHRLQDDAAEYPAGDHHHPEHPAVPGAGPGADTDLGNSRPGANVIKQYRCKLPC